MVNLDKLNKIASTSSTWKEEAIKRRENRAWQKHSQRIAIKVLKALREQNLKQKQLAEMIGVSPQQINKIVKGNENLTLQTIAKLEEALNIDLIFNEKNNQKIIVKDFDRKPVIFITPYKNRKEVVRRQLSYSVKEEFVCNNDLMSENYG